MQTEAELIEALKVELLVKPLTGHQLTTILLIVPNSLPFKNFSGTSPGFSVLYKLKAAEETALVFSNKITRRFNSKTDINRKLYAIETASTQYEKLMDQKKTLATFIKKKINGKAILCEFDSHLNVLLNVNDNLEFVFKSITSKHKAKSIDLNKMQALVSDDKMKFYYRDLNT